MRIGNRSRIKRCAALLTALLLALAIAPQVVHFDAAYHANYYVCALCLLASTAMLLYLYVNGQLDLFEPVTFIAAIYIGMYFYAPIHDLLIQKYDWFGYDLFPYGVRSTWIAFLGFLAFYVFYVKGFRFRFSGRERLEAQARPSGEFTSVARDDRIAAFILLLYAGAFAGYTYWLVRSSGNDLLYIMSLGMYGKGHAYAANRTHLSFLANSVYLLPALTLLYWEYSKNKWMTALMFAVMFLLQTADGYRFIIIQVAVSFLAYYYLKKGQRPSLRAILLAALVITVPILVMTVFRDAFKAGEGIALETLNGEVLKKAVDDTVWFNFRIYRNYYALVNAIPETYPYVYGGQMIRGTLAMVIPRALWPDKDTAAGMKLEEIIGARFVDTGQVYPNIGEYYYACGVFGVVLCMAIYGIWARSQHKKMLSARDPLDLIEYAILLGCNLQLVIRGYLPSNFWYLVFSVFPIAAVRLVRRILPPARRSP